MSYAQDTRQAELSHYDARLNEVYKAVLGVLPPDKQQKLRAAQKAWIAMRDSDCEWAFVDLRDCVIDRTTNRTKELEETWFMASNGDYSSIQRKENVKDNVSLNCNVEKYFSEGSLLQESEIKDKQLSYRVAESPTQAYVSRCGYSPPRKQVVCTQLKADKVSVTEKSKKYYSFRFHSDFQVSSDLGFVANDGHGRIAYGKCATATK